MKRPYTTLFLLVSVDGKISTGDTDIMDIDKDYKLINGVKEGNKQYYDLEQQTDLYSLNSGRVFEKIGMNEKTDEPQKTPVSFIVIDNKPHLNKKGTTYLAKKSKTLYVVTTNPDHPAFELKKEFPNIEILKYEGKIDLADTLKKLKQEYGVDRITIQTGGTMNASWVREGLIDRLLLVVAPAMVGGKDTSTLMDGESLHSEDELFKIKSLELVQAKPLENSYLLLEYNVKN
ncbi:MAG: dihydrofolate reductase family protein [Candidatus Wildermuthbacteria bacterium]|nr:dihydrofolate reductase family protein [Candidatus Wildermuthbacteria bacterium]